MIGLVEGGGRGIFFVLKGAGFGEEGETFGRGRGNGVVVEVVIVEDYAGGEHASKGGEHVHF